MPAPLTLNKLNLLGSQMSVGLGLLYDQAKPKPVKTQPSEKYQKTMQKIREEHQRKAFIIKYGNIGLTALADAAKFAAGAGAVAAGALIGVLTIGGLSSIGGLTAALIGASLTAGVITSIYSVAVNTTNYVLNFNINVTDEELDKQLEDQIKRFYGLFGNVVGSSMGYLVCGAIPGALSFAFNPTLAAAIMRDLDDEAREEVLGQVNVISRTAVQTLINAELANKFKSARRFLKKNPDNPFAQFVRGIIGEKNFKKWGDSNQPSWTIKKNIIENKIESLPGGWKEFGEEALEAFGDSCIESGFIIANNMDSYLAAQALMRDSQLGRQTDVSIVLGKRGTSTNPAQPQPKIKSLPQKQTK